MIAKTTSVNDLLIVSASERTIRNHVFARDAAETVLFVEDALREVPLFKLSRVLIAALRRSRSVINWLDDAGHLCHS